MFKYYLKEVILAEGTEDPTEEEIESDYEFRRNILAGHCAPFELKRERHTKTKFDKDDTYEPESSQPKKKHIKHMTKKAISGLVDEPEDLNVGVDMNIEKTLESSKADQIVEVEKTPMFDVNLDDAIDKLLNTPRAQKTIPRSTQAVEEPVTKETPKAYPKVSQESFGSYYDA